MLNISSIVPTTFPLLQSQQRLTPLSSSINVPPFYPVQTSTSRPPFQFKQCRPPILLSSLNNVNLPFSYPVVKMLTAQSPFRSDINLSPPSPGQTMSTSRPPLKFKQYQSPVLSCSNNVNVPPPFPVQIMSTSYPPLKFKQRQPPTLLSSSNNINLPSSYPVRTSTFHPSLQFKQCQLTPSSQVQTTSTSHPPLQFKQRQPSNPLSHSNVNLSPLSPAQTTSTSHPPPSPVQTSTSHPSLQFK